MVVTAVHARMAACVSFDQHSERVPLGSVTAEGSVRKRAWWEMRFGIA